MKMELESSSGVRFRNKLVILAMSLGVAVGCCGFGTAAGAAGKNGHAHTVTSKQAEIAAAKRQIDRYLRIPGFSAPGPAVDAKRVKGKTVVVVGYNADNSAVVDVANGAKLAGTIAGLNVRVEYSQSTNSVAEQQIEQAVKERVGAIIVIGALPLPVGPSAAHAAHIPIIGALQAQPVANAPGQGNGSSYFAGASGSYKLDGELDADTAIVASKGKPIKAVIDTFDFPVSTAAINGIEEVFSHCSFCHIVHTVSVEPANWATQLAPSTAAAVRLEPGINWVFTTVDSMAPFAVTGVKNAGKSSSVSVATGDGSGSGPLGIVQDGGILKADPGYNGVFEGWLAIDQALRGMTHMKPGNPTVPSRYLDQASLKGVNLNASSWPSVIYGDGYVKGFKKLWGV